MACPVCIQAFDLREVRPKALPCGHTVCQSCVGRLQQQCPTCRKAFEMPLPDNFALVEQLEALQLEGPRGSWWCMDCNSPAATQCVEEHSLRRPKAALRLGLQDVVPRARQALQGLQDGLQGLQDGLQGLQDGLQGLQDGLQGLQDGLQGLQDGLQGLQDGAALTALRLLRGPPATCRLTLRQDDGEAFGAEWRVDGQGAEDSLLQTLVVALAASGRLLQEPSAVHADAPPAAQQPADERIEKLDLTNLSINGPAARPEDKAETLRLVRQRGVRRMTNVWCSGDPDWALDVLRSAAPTLEELEVVHASEAHLAAVHGMPRLHRLDLPASLGKRPVELPALPWPSCLKWLRVEDLPRATTVSLLRAHAASLDVLWLAVGSEPGWAWPRECDDLDALLGQCGLRLTRLVLKRSLVPHGSSCRAQLEAARRVLPGCKVQCIECDGVPYEYF